MSTLFEFNEDGTISVKQPEIMLSRCTFGQYEDLRVSWAGVSDVVSENNEDEELDDDERNKRAGEAIGGWWAEVFSTLGDGPVDGDFHEWPAELVFNPQLPADTMRHWRGLPLAVPGQTEALLRLAQSAAAQRSAASETSLPRSTTTSPEPE